MNDNEYRTEVDEIFAAIEDALDILDEDLDIDTAGELLTVQFADDSSVIFSRQISNHEIWVAARSGGYHLHKQQDWVCSATSESLADLVNRVVSEQIGESTIVL